MTVSTPTALVAAAPTLLRQGLLAVLRAQCPELTITLVDNALQAGELLAQRTFGLVVLEGVLPGLDLDRLLGQLLRARPGQRLLVLADQLLMAQSASVRLHPEAQLFIPSHVPPHALAAVVAPWLSDWPRPMVPYSTVAARFSRRELEVLRLVVEDYCNEEIADQLFINVRTVESHRRNLLQKAGTRTLVGLAARAVREGWVA